MFDILQVVCWSITYILIILAGLENLQLGKMKMSIPCLAVILNLSWEFCALSLSDGYWGHVLWFGLDIIIFFINYIFLERKKDKIIYTGMCVCSAAILFGIFQLSQGMLLSCFVIDLIMAASFLFSQKFLSVKLKLPIAVMKLLGDAFAGAYYCSASVMVAVIAALVLIINSIYLYKCLKEFALNRNSHSNIDIV